MEAVKRILLADAGVEFRAALAATSFTKPSMVMPRTM